MNLKRYKIKIKHIPLRNQTKAKIYLQQNNSQARIVGTVIIGINVFNEYLILYKIHYQSSNINKY
jgi:hypothetical protein